MLVKDMSRNKCFFPGTNIHLCHIYWLALVLWGRMDMEGNGRGLIWGTILAAAWGDRKKTTSNLSWSSVSTPRFEPWISWIRSREGQTTQPRRSVWWCNVYFLRTGSSHGQYSITCRWCGGTNPCYTFCEMIMKDGFTILLSKSILILNHNVHIRR
jgi:hypothetical protein